MNRSIQHSGSEAQCDGESRSCGLDPYYSGGPVPQLIKRSTTIVYIWSRIKSRLVPNTSLSCSKPSALELRTVSRIRNPTLHTSSPKKACAPLLALPRVALWAAQHISAVVDRVVPSCKSEARQPPALNSQVSESTPPPRSSAQCPSLCSGGAKLPLQMNSLGQGTQADKPSCQYLHRQAVITFGSCKAGTRNSYSALQESRDFILESRASACCSRAAKGHALPDCPLASFLSRGPFRSKSRIRHVVLRIGHFDPAKARILTAIACRHRCGALDGCIHVRRTSASLYDRASGLLIIPSPDNNNKHPEPPNNKCDSRYVPRLSYEWGMC